MSGFGRPVVGVGGVVGKENPPPILHPITIGVLKAGGVNLIYDTFLPPMSYCHIFRLSSVPATVKERVYRCRFHTFAVIAY